MAASRSVSITRIFAGGDGQSHFEDLSVPLEEFFGHPAPSIAGQSIGFMAGLPATEMSFRVTPPGGDHPFHFSPGRSLQVTVQGILELGVGDGTTRRFGPGDFLLLDEQGSGQGHTSREIEPRVTVNIEIPTTFDLTPFRITIPSERNT